MLSSWRWQEIPTVAWTSGRWSEGRKGGWQEEVESLVQTVRDGEEEEGAKGLVNLDDVKDFCV
jgi:hypothetical protein